ncbi:MAG: HAD family hydrolase [Ruminococcaceae bacterium]|nr:HAD family hydrolase [Oscillospiraceae bacterium]
MNIKAVIFDKDGTLMDFESFWVTVSSYAIEDIKKVTGVTDVSVEEALGYLDVKDGIADINGILAQDPYPVMGRAINTCFAKYGCRLTDGEMTELTISAYHKNVEKGIINPACGDIVGIMKRLKNNGIHLAVITTDDPYDTKKCLTALGIYDYFDEIYTDDGVMPPKPDPYCLEMFLKKYGLEKNEVIMIGDTLNDVNFARNGGIKVGGVAKNKNNRKILEEKADFVMTDISEIFDHLN